MGWLIFPSKLGPVVVCSLECNPWIVHILTSSLVTFCGCKMSLPMLFCAMIVAIDFMHSLPCEEKLKFCILVIWTQFSGPHQSTLQGPPEKSCVSACTKSTAKLILWRQSPFPYSAIIISIETWRVQQYSVSTRFFRRITQHGVTKTQCTPHRCLCKTWSTREAVLAWYIVKFVIF